MRHKKLQKLVIICEIVAVLGLGYIFRHTIRVWYLELQKLTLPPEVGPYVTPGPVNAINLAVPFSPQAPGGDWSEPYENACEETSAFLVHAFYAKIDVTPASADQAIQGAVVWENKTFGYYQDTTVLQTARMLREHFGYHRVDVVYDIVLNDIKKQLQLGHPVIVPLAGRHVGNPYYRQPGPIYHMLVIKGITADNQFITNDVGTRHGENYIYDQHTLYNAIHDLPHGGAVIAAPDPDAYLLTGRKAMIVVYPN